jgi:hypothetical protein
MRRRELIFGLAGTLVASRAADARQRAMPASPI